MEIVSLKSNARKALTKQKGLYKLTETHCNFFYDVSFHWFLYKHDVFYVYSCYFIGF